MDIDISICFKMRNQLILSTYNGGVWCVILMEVSMFGIDD